MEEDIVQLSFLHKAGRHFLPAQIQTCEGDIILIINAILDYADLLEVKAAAMDDPFQAESARYYVGRFRRIAERYSREIKYSREKAIQNCEKKKHRKADDFGEEALALMVKLGNEKAKEDKKK